MLLFSVVALHESLTHMVMHDVTPLAGIWLKGAICRGLRLRQVAHF